MAAAPKIIYKELKEHAPFTAFGTLTGIVIMVIIIQVKIPRSISETLFGVFHPFHVLLSALVTAGIYRRHSRGVFWKTLLVGYFGAIGIGTLSDCLMPFVGEWLLDLPHRHTHIGFIEEWWLVNPLAIVGAIIAWRWSRTKFPHAGHVLVSTWASLFHMTMALGKDVSTLTFVLVPVFLFLAVWIPCCTSDIVFPLLFAKDQE